MVAKVYIFIDFDVFYVWRKIQMEIDWKITKIEIGEKSFRKKNIWRLINIFPAKVGLI